MKRASTTLLIVFCVAGAINLWAQNKKDNKKSNTKDAAKPKTKGTYPSVVPVYLGHSDISGGNIKKNVFDSLLRQGLMAKDSMGRNYYVQEFRFNYGEVNLYEDSSGLRMMPITDYNLEMCFGDTISADISASLYQRTKPGDTLYFDQVRLLSEDGDSASLNGKAMKFEIVR